MAQIILNEHEGIEAAIHRFKREVSQAKIFPDTKQHRHLETPSVETPSEKHIGKAIAKPRQPKKYSRH
ncbi:MAG: 30S ribosomal protein S21 [Trichocoleus desertorum ATA4-8-CV12]|jgi:small subunit ribosomal protein S21|nr:30S ribosomal protein S21 [Trichocoleus desertorum ATA4-8-CV12]